MIKSNRFLKRSVLITVVIASFVITNKPTFAKTGIGIIAGSPSAITLKINNFPVIQVGYSVFDNNPYFSAAVDWWFLNPSIGGDFKFFLGVGAGVTFANDLGLGVRVPVGVQWLPSSLIEVFVQGVPTLNVIPATTYGTDWGIGIRFYFI